MSVMPNFDEGATQARSGACRRAARQVSSSLVDGLGVLDDHDVVVGGVDETRQVAALIDSL